MSDWKGLSSKEAAERLKEYGLNEITETSKVSALEIFLRQIKKNFVVYFLFFAMILSFYVGKDLVAYTIIAVLVIVIGVGFVMEYRAEKAIKALKKMIMPVYIAIRDGKEIEVKSTEIVPGDILISRTGEKVPADCLVLESRELRVNESILTGESAEIKKVSAESESDYSKENQLFMGTHIVNGKAIVKVLHTGMNTEFGKIAKLISTAEKEMPLQQKLNRIVKYAALVAVTLAVISGIVLFTRLEVVTDAAVADILIVVIALCVAGFPEGFPVVLISSLSKGAYRMSQKNAIVNRMAIIEPLGETTVICSDKTGTITKGEMTVRKIFINDHLFDVTGVGYEGTGDFLFEEKKIEPLKNPELSLLLKSAVLCNDAKIERKGTDHDYNIRGTPTEAALLIMSAKAGVFNEDFDCEREEEIPFTSERKMMSVLCKEPEGHITYVKGAPEVLIESCKFVQKEGKIVKLDEAERKRILDCNTKLTLQKFRVIGFAFKKENTGKKEDLENDLVFVGFAAMEDPPRPEVKRALEICSGAGITVKMITGDNKETAVEIAREIGLTGEVITGKEIDNLTDDEFEKIVSKITIFARVRPDHKIRIVRALKKQDEIVTMTGDGVNDAPALKEANIGVAMGLCGTDVSREASDIVLKDDNFATIVEAIIEGRTIYSNIQKFTSYQLSCIFAEMFALFVGILLIGVAPLLPLQILFMNLVTSEVPSLALGFNPPSLDVMKQKARKKVRIMGKEETIAMLMAAFIVGVGTLGAFYYFFVVLEAGIVVSTTAALLTLILFEVVNAFNFRSFRYPVYKLPLFANPLLVYAAIISVAATLLIMYTPLNIVFETAPLGIETWLVIIAASFSIVVVFDVYKIIKKKRNSNNHPHSSKKITAFTKNLK